MKKFSPAPKLRDVVKKLADAGITQDQIAEAVYGSARKQGKVSSGMASAKDTSTWEKHWQVFAKFIPFAIDSGAIAERDLLGVETHGSTKDHGGSKTGGAKGNQR